MLKYKGSREVKHQRFNFNPWKSSRFTQICMIVGVGFDILGLSILCSFLIFSTRFVEENE